MSGTVAGLSFVKSSTTARIRNRNPYGMKSALAEAAISGQATNKTEVLGFVQEWRALGDEDENCWIVAISRRGMCPRLIRGNLRLDPTGADAGSHLDCPIPVRDMHKVDA